MTVRELAIVDELLNRARAKTQESLQAFRRRRRKWKRQAGPYRTKLERSLERRRQRILRAWHRDYAADDNTEHLQRQEALVRWDALIAGLKAESKAVRHQKDSRARSLLAAKFRTVAEAFGRRDVDARAEKLENAGKFGWWGVREADGSVVVRLRDRSGLIMLDPAEARERTAELIKRLVPLLIACSKNGLEIHKAVFSEPNIPAGSLKWGKNHLFQRFVRTILERDAKGQEIPRTFNVRHGGRWLEVDNAARKFPEIVAAFAVQEDPLAADEHHFNTHLNVILVVDPGQCSPLDRELWPEDPETGKPKPDPAADLHGMFSYMKLRHVWGSEHQVHIRWLQPTITNLRDQLLEVIKYSCKTVSEKSLEKFDHAKAQECNGVHHHGDPEDRARLLGDSAGAGAGNDADADTRDAIADRPVLELTGEVVDQDEARRPAPAMIDWPDARVIEWIDANKGFRRVRSWGCLYRLGKIPRATNPDEGIRWLGRIWVDPWKITVQMGFIGEASPVDLIQENKSYCPEPLPRAQSPPSPAL